MKLKKFLLIKNNYVKFRNKMNNRFSSVDFRRESKKLGEGSSYFRDGEGFG